MLTRRQALAAPLLALPSRAAARKTNVVIFMTDDHGAWASGAYGCKEMHTPNIDALASTGAKFTNAFACTPVCSPSRMTYMTGKIPSQHGVQDYLRQADSSGDSSRRWLDRHLTYSEVLARNGYTLGMCGKWHMGEDTKPQAGFTYWATVAGGGGSYRNPTFVKNGVKGKINDFKTDATIDCALEFLEGQKKDSAFLLQVPFHAPHTPYDFQPEQDRKWYEDSSFSCFPDAPMHEWQNENLGRHHRNRESKHAYSALVSGVDRNVGRVLKQLDQMGVRENTLIVFTADQGWNAGHHGLWGKGNGTVPYNMYEESIRVPLIWNHPGRIQAGLTPSPMVSSYDFFPTLLDYLGVEAPADRQRVGRSYAAFVKGGNPRWRDRLYFEYGYTRAIRTRNLKYIQRIRKWPSELYDLEADPGETRNIISDDGHARQREAL
ncbi:MAG: sulfatase family protein, partial [Bryobacteraceae bacterium]